MTSQSRNSSGHCFLSLVNMVVADPAKQVRKQKTGNLSEKKTKSLSMLMKIDILQKTVPAPI